MRNSRRWISTRWWAGVALPLSLAFLGTTFAAAPVAANWEDAPRQGVFLQEDSATGLTEFRARLEEAGGHVSVVLSHHSAIVYAPRAAIDEALGGLPAVVTTEAIDPLAVDGFTAMRARDARIWNRFLPMRAAASREHAHAHADQRPPLPDAGPVPVELPAMPPLLDAPDHIPYGAEYYDTSTYLAGTSAVGVWLLEAAGSTYDWSTAEEDETLAGVAAGLDTWVAFGGAMASLTFVLDIHTGVPVSGVPIENPQSWDTFWIDEVLDNQGWPGANAFERCFAYNSDLRDNEETNWAFSIFMVDSDPDVNQGLFQGGGYAWAYYGGPYMWMSRYSTWAYNAANYFQAVPAHESWHIYFATDEYDDFTQFSGYLNNPDYPNSTINCLLNQNSLTRVCNPTKKQVAWRDTDGNGVMEPLDTPPAIALDELLPDPIDDPQPTWTGNAVVTTLNNLNPNSRYNPPHDITINTISAVECRVDGGPWSAASATDGAFDAYVEDYTWTAPELANGVHLVEARSQSSEGIWSDVFASDTITVEADGVGVVVGSDLALRLEVGAPNPTRTNSEIRFAIPAAGRVTLEIFTVDGTRVRTLLDEAHAAGAGAVRWDGRDEAGREVSAGVYFVKLKTGAGVRTEKVVRQR